MTVPLYDQITHLVRIREELGPDPELSAAIKTLQLIAEFPDEVRAALVQARERKKARELGGVAAERLLKAFPDGETSVRGGE